MASTPAGLICSMAGTCMRRMRAAAGAAPPNFLWGEVSFGDNIQDEWFIVSLLLHATAQLPDLCARVWDNDGEFLLIEAAYCLPKWVKPEVAENRVFLYRGSLHLIPLPSAKHPTIPMQPSLPEALGVLRSLHPLAEASAEVQHMVRSRLAGLPHTKQHTAQGGNMAAQEAWQPGAFGAKSPHVS
mmetsp:Transcript_12071/g.30482  ORF Transcript_12071/g.30482 Transcript_12071/m.30482 type:complete len:185 (-) Transcript_12071:310-864(-)